MRTTGADVLLLAWSLLLGGSALASGADRAEDGFVSRRGTDVALERFDKGELGVVLPSYPRVYLYPAWRAIVLGNEGLRARPGRPGGLLEAVGSRVEGWIGDQHPFHDWQRASANLATRAAAPAGAPVYRSLSRGYSQYLNCAAPAFVFALQNLETLRKRPDATPARLRDWVAAQDSVFGFCDYDPTAKPVRPNAPPPPVMPTPLAASEPLAWQQLREYQIATAHFYNDSYAESTRRFDAIGATAGHPMQPWGAYLALRSEMRALTHDALMRQQQSGWQRPAMATIAARGARILADPALAPLHEATRASLRAAQFRLLPRERLEELSRRLDDAKQDPYRGSALGDWRRLANELLESGPPAPQIALEASLRQRHAYIDWMRTLQRCGLARLDGQKPEEACGPELANAQKRWQAADTGAGERRAWFVAALMLSQQLTPALETQALGIAATAPEYLTVRYNLARLYRLAGRPAQAREVSDAVLSGAALAGLRSSSATVLFQQERFASAQSLDDAAAFITRRSAWLRDPDTGETVARQEQEARPRLASDGLAWLNTRLSVDDLLALAAMERLPADIRAQVAVAAWMRADLLGARAQADAAAALARNLPQLREAAARYLAAPGLADKRHILLLASIRLGLSPLIPDYPPPYLRPPPASPPEDEPVTGMWCSIGRIEPDTDPWQAQVEQTPPPPDLSGLPQVRDREITALGKIGTATGLAGAHALQRVKTHPADPDLPWLLHVVVQSTRGGCVDPGNSTLSRTAFNLLHTRFRNSPWAKKTPYWF